jgi:pectinesterase
MKLCRHILLAAGVTLLVFPLGCSSEKTSSAADAAPTDEASVGMDATVDASRPAEAGIDSSDDAAISDGGLSDGTTPGLDGGGGDGMIVGDANATCTSPRPQLTDTEAAKDTTLAYLAQAGFLSVGLVTDNWDPTAGVGDVATFTPTYTVTAGTGTYPTVQSAITAAVGAGGTSRVYVLVNPGTYPEVVCVPMSAPPITLYGASGDASTQPVIVAGNYNGETKAAGAVANPCTPNASATTYGTAGSATFSAFAKGFQAENITFSNDVTTATLGATAGTQAVALMTQADQVVLENVRVLGHQDTLYLETSSVGTVVRTYVKNSYIAGDVDFIFGGATSVLDGCQIQFVSDRRLTGQVISPDTASLNPYGILVTNGNFTADATTGAGSVGLGRAWDRSCVDIPTYLSTCLPTGDYPNGQAVVRNSALGAQIAADPWLAAATTKRAFCNTAWDCLDEAGAVECPANRLFEYENTGPGSTH